MITRTNWRRWLTAGAGWFVLASRLSSASTQISGTVPAGLPAGATVAVVVPVPAGLATADALNAQLRVQDHTQEVTLQVEPADRLGGTPSRAWFMWKVAPEATGKSAVLEIGSAQRAAGESAYIVRDRDPFVEVSSPDGKPVLSYRYGKPDPTYKYAVTSYIHPLIGLDGEVLTDSNPKDHLHHRGLFWAWVRIQWGDKGHGEWWVPDGFAMESHHLATTSGPVFGGFTAGHYLVFDPTTSSHPAEGVSAGTRVLDEYVVCRIFPTAPTGRAIDVDLTLTAMQDRLRIGGQTQLNKGYGGLTLRYGADPTHSGKARAPKIVAEGKTIEKDLNHLVARWVDWTGMFDGPDGRVLPDRSGGAVFVHPSHPPLPASAPEWITRNYGPINVAYPGLDMLDLPRDKPLRLRYRVWIHRGDAGSANVDGQYRAYAADWKWETIQ